MVVASTGRAAWVALALAACGPVAPEPAQPERDLQRDTVLARFMRERVNVPFSFALVEHVDGQHPRRVYRAAVVLREAAQSLIHWNDPPVASAEARQVFYAYAQNLEYHVSLLEVAAGEFDAQESSLSLLEIRDTCNSCHRFFRPASLISNDVALDGAVLALEEGTR